MGAQETWVYRYSYWDDASNSEKISERYATMDSIRSGLGIPVFSTAKKVPLADVPDGIYRPQTPGPD